MTTDRSRLLKLAREMLYLERLAKVAERRRDTLEANRLWLRREEVMEQRARLLREHLPDD